MALEHMKVFNDYIMPATIETLAQEINKFNEASGGAIQLSTEGFTGDFMRSAFFGSLAAAKRRVDRYAALADQAATPLTEIQGSKVKVAGGFGPISFEPSQFTWLQRPTQQAVVAISNSFTELLLQDQLNTVIAALVAAIGNQPNLVNDVSGTASPNLTYSVLNGAHAKFGDKSAIITTNVMDGAAYHRLVDVNLTNAQQLFQFNSVQVVEVLGKRAIITDAPALYQAGAPNKHKVLGLVPAAAMVEGAGDVITNVQTENGNTRIQTTFQADYSFTIGLKGYGWDEANGGKSPDDAAIGTGSNWDKVAQFDKMTAGVMAIAAAV